VRETGAQPKVKLQTEHSSGDEDVITFSAKLPSDTPEQCRDGKDTTKQRNVKKERQANACVRRQSAVSKSTSRREPIDGAAPPVQSPQKVANLSQNYFGLMPSSDVSRQSIARMLHGTAISYTSLFPPAKNAKVGQMAKDWFQQCLKTKGILHTALYCQAKRTQAMRPGMMVLPVKELVLCQTEALHAINDKLTQSATACDDESLRIVFSLTWHGAVKQDMLHFVPRQAPMGHLQSLRFFMGIINCDPVHAQGLDNMIALRGGLDKLEMPGLAFLISYGDVLLASLYLSRPKWSYGSYAQHNVDAHADGWLSTTARPNHPLSSLGKGFSRIHSWLPNGRATPLHQVLINLANYTRASDDFLNQRPEAYGQAVMTDQRNSTQHMLMSLLLSNDDDYFDSCDLYELCWLAAVAYSMVATFPLAPNAAPFGRIAQLIRFKMSSSTVLTAWSREPHLMLWMTVMGAVCAVGTPDRTLYVEVLRQEALRLDIHDWNDLRAHLMNFLWFPVASDVDGLELWEDIDMAVRVSSWQEYDGDQG